MVATVSHCVCDTFLLDKLDEDLSMKSKFAARILNKEVRILELEHFQCCPAISLSDECA